MQQTLPMPMFLTGQVVATPGALKCLQERGVDAIDLVTRHVYGDWGEMCIQDQLQNLLAVKDGFRVFTSYVVGEGEGSAKVWCITEADRSSTTVLLPAEY
jgi:hypothetical protein